MVDDWTESYMDHFTVPGFDKDDNEPVAKVSRHAVKVIYTTFDKMKDQLTSGLYSSNFFHGALKTLYSRLRKIGTCVKDEWDDMDDFYGFSSNIQ